MSWVEELAGAIIKQACVDYRDWSQTVAKYEGKQNLTDSQRKQYMTAKRGLPEVESFFLSDWFIDLSFGNLDGEALLANLKREVRAQEEQNIA